MLIALHKFKVIVLRLRTHTLARAREHTHTQNDSLWLGSDAQRRGCAEQCAIVCRPLRCCEIRRDNSLIGHFDELAQPVCTRMWWIHACSLLC